MIMLIVGFIACIMFPELISLAVIGCLLCCTYAVLGGGIVGGAVAGAIAIGLMS